MNTFLLKIGCTLLFGFIFFLSFQTETAHQQQLSSHQNQELIKQEVVVISTDAVYSSVADYETKNGYENSLLDK